MIHGRYQPFHIGHAKVLQTALGMANSVCVGITNPDPGSWRPHSASGHRHRPEANPFTYLERMRLVGATALDYGCHPLQVSIVPFPLDRPESWPFYVPADALHLVPVFSDWEESKVVKLRAHGYDVKVLDKRGETKLNATDIRQQMAAGLSWQRLVPEPVAPLLQEFLEQRPLAQRLRNAPSSCNADQ